VPRHITYVTLTVLPWFLASVLSQAPAQTCPMQYALLLWRGLQHSKKESG